ncbi:MAG TPA: class I SAM-dependent methyltransferase [Polyangiaceae bacterium]|nr:class I SAM-dependent methyltransferase [Polyangiaceae bacterium]
MQPPSPLRELLSTPALQKFVRTASDWVDLQESLLLEVLKQVAPRAHGRLLDVGCGQRPYESIFEPHVSQYIGIEHEATFGRTQASKSTRAPDFYYDGVRLPFEDKSFDTVLNVQVLEHTPEPGRLVSEMGRVLKDDGLLILTAPFDFRLHEQPYDFFRYTPHGLRTLCEKAGLELVETRNLGSLWSIVAHKLNTYLAFRVARIGGVAQAMGKLQHEGSVAEAPRLWTFPLIAPLMIGLSAGARVLDHVLEEPDESMAFLILARRKPRAVV